MEIKIVYGQIKFGKKKLLIFCKKFDIIKKATIFAAPKKNGASENEFRACFDKS